MQPEQSVKGLDPTLCAHLSSILATSKRVEFASQAKRISQLSFPFLCSAHLFVTCVSKTHAFDIQGDPFRRQSGATQVSSSGTYPQPSKGAGHKQWHVVSPSELVSQAGETPDMIDGTLRGYAL